jgi:alpha-tubulin suppressor-like RCC1 family protein
MFHTRKPLLIIGASLPALALSFGSAGAASAKSHRPPPPMSCLTVHAWGAWFGGDTTDGRIWPTAATIPDTTPGACVTQVASSNSDDYALTSDGEVWAWGLGANGGLGDGGTADSLVTPVQVQFPAGTVLTQLAVDVGPFDTMLAVDAAGNMWVWGEAKRGPGCAGIGPFTTPVQAPGVSDVTLIAGADAHSEFYGTYQGVTGVFSCGVNAYGVLGDGSLKTSFAPVLVSLPDSTPPVALVSSWEDAGALLADGSYYDWGYNVSGQLGDGTTASSDVPI